MIKFNGVLPALVTPLNDDETVNAPVLHKLMSDLLNEGAYGFYVGGATGEGIALSREAREHLAYEATSFAKGKTHTIIHIASTNFNDAIELAKQAERCGADAISAIPPIYFSYDENDVYNYYKKIASSVHIPLMIYYTPAANFPISPEFAARLFGIDNITAIKWTSSDYYGMLRLKDITHGEMNIINGPDEMLLMGLNAGADGGIGTTYNINLGNVKAVYENFKKGDIAQAQSAQMRVNAAIAAFKGQPIIPAVKAVLEEMGYAVGNAAFPMKRYSANEKKAIYEKVIPYLKNV